MSQDQGVTKTMPHRIEKLRETLQELESELASVEELDNESRKLLQTAATEIQDALQKDEAQEAVTSAGNASQTWTDKLYDVASDFEESHPSLSRLVGNVASALAQLGI